MDFLLTIDGGGEMEAYLFSAYEDVSAYLRDRLLSECAWQLRECIPPDTRLIADTLELLIGGIGEDRHFLYSTALLNLGYIHVMTRCVPTEIDDRRRSND